ncbi:MAG: hypothetical protein K5986_12650 [Clostridium sp.]|uniref:hypothetical protein n=1 Tax=Clostridium sp. DSM 8431 TaxID=1761781 RepID=UPI0008E22A07|nr:hypothetical protein [Clostridium sp. DSM 8431]MCR4945251.1 hypothetical protein [Clostridium sp.]SFU40507.1 hypothetical protein SAMN04487886_102010 [Clostridium sp. DSM 8431]
MKYKFLKITGDIGFYRDVYLENEETGKIECCFDDSILSSTNNFEFMKIEESYECKIALFGTLAEKAVVSMPEYIVECTVIDRRCSIGRLNFMKVEVEGSTYYIQLVDLGEDFNNTKFKFQCTRKDLIQVDDVIHHRIL